MFSTGLEIQLRKETADSSSRLACFFFLLGRSFDSFHLDILQASMLTWSGASTILQGELIATDAGQNCGLKRRSLPLSNNIQGIIIVLVHDVSRSLLAWRPVWRNSFRKQRKDNQEKEIRKAALCLGAFVVVHAAVYRNMAHKQTAPKKQGPQKVRTARGLFCALCVPGNGTACVLSRNHTP